MDRFLQEKLSEPSVAPPRPRTAPSQTASHAERNVTPSPSVRVGGVGRARRLEYIPIAVVCYLVNTCCLGLVLEVHAILAVLVVFRVVMIVENARRLHDVGYSGWWQLVPCYMLIVAFYRGQVGENKYGQDPRKREGAYATKARAHRH